MVVGGSVETHETEGRAETAETENIVDNKEEGKGKGKMR